ncbi:RNI-like protein [Phellopilus nigrolimitatus]|nr:RNI-like protein [Phellopilus nigrolimitatus]
MDSEKYRYPKLGRRINLRGQRGTIKYIGEVQGTCGTWLGVEWDDASRGKHDGEKDGKHYFTCKVPGSGSFIRPSPSITYGQSFLRALISKYVELPRPSGRKETVILGSSNGIIEVEAVGLDKVRDKLAKLEYLRGISLDTEDVAYPDPPGEIRKTCRNVRSLDISASLLPSWDMVALITTELPTLRALNLNYSRFSTLLDAKNLHIAFLGLEELRVNQTMVVWPEVILLISAMPNLRYLEIGYNNLKSLGGATQNLSFVTKLETMNFDGNSLEDWTDVMISSSAFTSLDRIILTSNQIVHIPRPAPQASISNIKHIGLHNNLLSNWYDIDALDAWLPNLQTLNIGGNPLGLLLSGSKDFRQQAIARLPSLTSLNGTSVSPKERSDCEIYYLSHVSRSNLVSDEERSKEHPRWQELCRKHGAPENAKIAKGRDTLADRLININVYRCDSAEAERRAGAGNTAIGPISDSALAPLSPPSTLRVLPTMTMRVFRLKLMKALKLASGRREAHQGFQPHLGAWLMMDGDDLTELDFAQEARDLAWWGVRDGSRVLVCTEEAGQAHHNRSIDMDKRTTKEGTKQLY